MSHDVTDGADDCVFFVCGGDTTIMPNNLACWDGDWKPSSSVYCMKLSV